MVKPAVRAPALRLLRRGPFARYTLFNLLSLVGSWSQRVACGWLVWEWTDSAFWLGVLAATDLMPAVVVGPVAGAVADRWSRLAVNRVGQTVLTAIAALCALLIATQAMSLALLLVLTTLQGVFVALCQPARLALVQELVPRADVGPAVAIGSVNVNLARLIGPAVAAAMILQADIAWIFAGNAVVTALFVMVLGTLRVASSGRAPLSGGVLSQIADGLRYVMADPALRLVLLGMLAGGVLVRSLGELLPAFAARSFAETATGLAVLTSAMAFGAVSAGLTVGARTGEAGLLRQAMLSWSAAAVFGIGFALVVQPWLAAALAAGTGHGVARGLILTQTFVQLRTPDAVRGRALSVHGLIARGSPSVGALGIGTAADAAGLGTAAAVACAAFLAIVLVMTPALRREMRQLARDDAAPT